MTEEQLLQAYWDAFDKLDDAYEALSCAEDYGLPEPITLPEIPDPILGFVGAHAQLLVVKETLVGFLRGESGITLETIAAALDRADDKLTSVAVRFFNRESPEEMEPDGFLDAPDVDASEVE